MILDLVVTRDSLDCRRALVISSSIRMATSKRLQNAGSSTVVISLCSGICGGAFVLGAFVLGGSACDGSVLRCSVCDGSVCGGMGGGLYQIILYSSPVNVV